MNQRRAFGVYPLARVLMAGVGHRATIADEFGGNPSSNINFGSQDYLGLAQREELKDAVREVIDLFGVHSAGSPALCGRTRILLDLEQKLSQRFGMGGCIVYPTGWTAGFGAITGFVRPDDTVLIDALSHNCLHEGASHATNDVRKFAHNNLSELEDQLREVRDKKPRNGLFVVIESLYSMDSDSPDLAEAVRLARKYEAIVILDVAHDFGAVGKNGLGLLETVDSVSQPDIIVGSFSKTFAATGGFVACSAEARDYLTTYSAPNFFSNAMSPLQTAVVNRAFDIIFSDEGEALRARLMKNVLHLREAVLARDMTIAGTPSPIVPIFVGNEKIARLTFKRLTCNGLLANLVEFPAVARGKARFRFQVMATHEPDTIQQAAEIMARSKMQAEKEWAAMGAME